MGDTAIPLCSETCLYSYPGYCLSTPTRGWIVTPGTNRDANDWPISHLGYVHGTKDGYWGVAVPREIT